MTQKRNIVITNNAFYNVHKCEIKRSIRYIDFAGLSKSADPNNGEFIIHVEDAYDYHFPNTDVTLRDELFENLKAAYFMKRNKNLPIYKVQVPLKTYLTTKKDIEKNIQHRPPNGYLAEAEDKYDPYSKGQQTAANVAATSSIT